MSDGTSTWGVDTSRYQPLGTYNPEQFEIVNIEDPGWFDKWARNRADGRPTGFYLWIYPGHQAGADARWAVAKIRGAGFGDPELGLWADFEEAGVEQWQLDQFFAVCDAVGMKSGYYSSPHQADHGPLLSRSFWLAVYPNANDGSFPGYGALWSSSRPRDLQLWQYTSSANGPAGLDRNVVVDDAWYSTFAGGSTAAPAHEEDDVKDDYICHRPSTLEAWVVSGNTKRLMSSAEWQYWNGIAAALNLPAPSNIEIPVAMFDSIPTVATVTVDTDAVARAIADRLPAHIDVDASAIGVVVRSELDRTGFAVRAL